MIDFSKLKYRDLARDPLRDGEEMGVSVESLLLCATGDDRAWIKYKRRTVISAIASSPLEEDKRLEKEVAARRPSMENEAEDAARRLALDRMKARREARRRAARW